MNHIELGIVEDRAAANPSKWDLWIGEVEANLRRDNPNFNIDGDQVTDGYSIDMCRKWFNLGMSHFEQACIIRDAIHQKQRG